MTRNDVPPGKGQCDIRLQVDNEVEVSVRRDMVFIHTIAGQDARDDGSECNVPLPDRDPRAFNFQVVDSRNEIRLNEPPSRRNDFAAIVWIHDTASGFGRYHFRLSWEITPGDDIRRDADVRPAPEGFAWNNVVSFRGRGQGESRFEGLEPQRLFDVSVDIDRGAKIGVSFSTGRGRPLLFTGAVIGQDGGRIRADVRSEDGRLRGTMVLSVDDRQNVNSITLDATDGRDRQHVTWDRR
ncbi:MAG TPA: hypothetical protein VLY04_25465 [Bryobacteraceae bacterium]|nr:hypothetical protein [Bryobacteraceae bacterium]